MPLDNTSYLLIEIPAYTYPGMVRDTLSEIIRKGLTPLIAHPERCHLFHEKQNDEKQKKQSRFFNLINRADSLADLDITFKKRDQELLNWLLAINCGFQCDLQSFKGVYGEMVKRTAEDFNIIDIYTHHGTDAHSTNCLEKLFGRTS
jgi:protein-tyrosine phosphatase